MKRLLPFLPFLPLLPLLAQEIPPLPTPTHVLALARAPDGAMWVGTYGAGIYVLHPGAHAWSQLVPDTTDTSISMGFVHAFAFAADGAIWYGTVGNGWGRSHDDGATWTNWTFRQLGPEYQYVAPDGMVFRGDTLYVATADGVKVTWDDGASWRVITDSLGVRSAKDPALGVIGNQYVLTIAAGADGRLWLSHLGGLERSDDGGRTWWAAALSDDRIRAILPERGDTVLIGTERGTERVVLPNGGRLARVRAVALPGAPVAVQQIVRGADGAVGIATSGGFVETGAEGQGGRDGAVRGGDPYLGFVTSALALGEHRWLLGSATGLRESDSISAALGASAAPAAPAAPVAPAAPRHTWFQRPVREQPYIDQTYRYGSTMGGFFQQHQGVEFNAGEGTPIHAIGDGVVAFAGPAEAGANAVAIRHDRSLRVGDTTYVVYSTYYHATELLTEQGRRVRAGDVIARVGNTGRATNDHLHLEVHALPVDSFPLVIDPAVRYPPYSTNPELWIAPLPGTGIVAGRVFDAAGSPVLQARIYGLVKPEPQETPFSFIETYGTRTRGTPAYREHFAIGDVPPGTYELWVEIDGRPVRRRITVVAGRVTWVELRP
jgi:murein DD-endopeptidase MepM/ murein hydrolase activator NlpD